MTASINKKSVAIVTGASSGIGLGITACNPFLQFDLLPQDIK